MWLISDTTTVVDMTYILLVCLIGVLVTALVLILLILFLTCISKFLGSKAYDVAERIVSFLVGIITFRWLVNLIKSKKEKNVSAAQPSVLSECAECQDEDEQTVAAITAALYAYYDIQVGQSSAVGGTKAAIPPPPFKIKSIKRI